MARIFEKRNNSDWWCPCGCGKKVRYCGNKIPKKGKGRFGIYRCIICLRDFTKKELARGC